MIALQMGRNKLPRLGSKAHKKLLIACRVPIPLGEDIPGLRDLSDDELSEMISNWRKMEVFFSNDNARYSTAVLLRLFNEVERRWLLRRDSHG